MENEDDDEDTVFDMYGEPVGKKKKIDYTSEAKESMSGEELASQVAEGYVEVGPDDEERLTKKATNGTATAEEIRALYAIRNGKKAQIKAPEIKASFPKSERKYSSGKSTTSDAKSSGRMSSQVTEAIKRIKANAK